MPTRDRLPHLLQRTGGAAPEPAPPPAPRPDLDQLFQEAERVFGLVRELDEHTRLVRRLHADPTYHNNKQLQDQLESVVRESNALGVQLCDGVRSLESLSGVAGAGAGARARMSRALAASARALTRRALDAHHAALLHLRDRQLLLLHQQIKLTNATISDEECESLLDSQNIALFVNNVRAETAAARVSLREAEARRAELARAEAALRDLRDLFHRLAHLVAAQQEQIDTVEYYALQATEYVECGGQQLLKGTVSHAKARKKKWGLVICLVSGAAVVLLVLVAT